MGFLDCVNNATSVSGTGAYSQMIINGGNANADIEVLAENACIWTGNGNQSISAGVSDYLYVRTGDCGADDIIATASTADIKTYAGDDNVIVMCDSLSLDVGEGDDVVGAYATRNFSITGGNGNKDVTAEASMNSRARNYISFRDGDQTIQFVANNTFVTTGEGQLDLDFVGDNCRVTSGHGDSKIGFYGDNATIKVGNGAHDIRTLDNWYQGGYTNYDLADALQNKTAGYDGNGNLCFDFRGAKNLTIEVGKGSLQGLVTVGDGTLTIKEGDALDNVVTRQIEILTGANPETGQPYGELNFEEGIFRGQNGYILYPRVNQTE